LKKIGIAVNRARYFIRCGGKANEFLDFSPARIKEQILAIGTSKYAPNFSPQLKIF
jgi:hypothetical protein